MRIIKYILGFITVVVIVIAALVAVLMSSDLELVRKQLEARGTKDFGRPVSFNGAIRLQPSLYPVLVFEDVVISNPDWASRPYFAKAKRSKIKVALLPLLWGELEVLNVVFDGADVLLETRPDGVNNYTFGDKDSPSVLPAIHQFGISDSLVGNRYPDQTERTLAIKEAKIVNIDGQPVTIDGEAEYRELPVRFSLVGGNPSEFAKPSRPWPVQLDVKLSDASLALDGHVAKPLTWEGGDYQVTIKGEQTQTLKEVFDLDLPSAGPYEFSTQLRSENGRHHLTDISSSIRGIENMPDLRVSEGTASVSAGEPIHLVLEGEYGDVPFALDLEGGAYTQLLATAVNWPMKLSARLAEINLDARGVITQEPESGPAVDVEIMLKGVLGNHIPPLFGFESPVSGPIELSARVTAANERYAATGIAGHIDDPKTVGKLKLSRGEVSAGGGEPTKLSLTGTIDESAFTTTLEGGSFAELVSGKTPWPVKISARAGGAIFTADGTVEGIGYGPSFDAKVELKGNNLASLNPLFDATLPRIGPYELSAQVRHTADGVLTLSGLSSRIRDSDLSGEVQFKYAQANPTSSWKLVSKNLHLDQLFLARERRSAARNVFDLPIKTDWFPGFSEEVSLRIKNLFGLGVPIRNASLNEKLSTEGNLIVDPIQMTVAGSVIDASFRAVIENGVPVVTLDARSDGIDLGKTLQVLKLGDDIKGKAEKFVMSFESRGGTLRSWLENARGTITIEPANLSFRDPVSDKTISLRVARAEVLTEARSPLKLIVDARVRSVPMSFNAEIDTLANTIIRNKPWPLKVSLRGARATLEAKGKVAHPTEGRGFSVDFDLKGEKLRELDPLLGYVLPLVGSYRIKGHFADDRGRYHFTNLQSRIGKSDLEGNLTIKTNGRRPHISGTLASKKLDLNDVVLRDVDAKKETAAHRVIPDYTIPDEALRAIDLDLDAKAERVVVGTATLGDLVFKVNLKDGRFIVSPFELTGLTKAKIKAKYYHDASAESPTSSVQVTARDLNYGLLLKRLDVTDLVEGRLDVDAYLAGPGGTRRRFLSGASGQITIVGGQGKFASRKLERWAADLTTTMLSSAWDREDVTDINCVVARINVDKGIAKSDEILVDTKRITIAGSGALDLQTEKLDLVLTPAPKRASLVSLANPVRVEGPLSSPNVSQVALTKKGMSIVLAAGGLLAGLVNPAFAILAFSDIGTGEKNPCVAAIDNVSTKAEKRKRDKGVTQRTRRTIRSITEDTID